MPWTAADAKRHTKAADTPKKQRQWAAVANSARQRCIDKGRDPKECDARAVRQANGVVSGKSKSFPMRITKATVRHGGMYWQGVVSDDDWDEEDERLDVAIFNDFRNRFDSEKHKADFEPPFVSLSHYGRLGGKGERGTIEDVWPDGKDFYTEGWFNDDSLSRRCFEVVRDELDRMSAGEKIDDPVRFSIAFLPLERTKEQGRTVYLKGILDHVALTRVPVNPRTGFTQVTEKSMTTKREDALSIVGEDYADEVDELEEEQRTTKSQADDLIIKAEDEDIDPSDTPEEEESPFTTEQDLVLHAMLLKAGIEDEDELTEKAWDYAYKKSLPDSAYAWVEHGEGCSKEDGKIPQRCRHLPYKDKSGKIDCAHVRAALQAVGGARTGKKMSVPSGIVQKLRRALKSCGGQSQEKAEILETEISEYEAGRIDGFNSALDMLGLSGDTLSKDNDMSDEVIEKDKSSVAEDADTVVNRIIADKVDLDAILEDYKAYKPTEPEPEPEAEVKAEVQPPDEIDTHVGLLRQIISAEGHGRVKKLEVAGAVLRSFAAHIEKAINETTPASPEDVAASMKSQVEEALRPMMDKIAVLEAAVMGDRPDAPKSKALSFEISPESTMLAAKGATGDAAQSPITQMVNESVGLPKDYNRKPVL